MGTIEDVHEAFAARYAMAPETRGMLEAVMATIAAHRLTRNHRDIPPVWLMLVAPPSSLKTIVIESTWGIADPTSTVPKSDVINLDVATANALVSGYKDEKSGADCSLLSELDGHIITVKDLTTLLSKRHQIEQFFGQLRVVFDGAVDAKSGNSEGRRNYRIRVGAIFGTVPSGSSDVEVGRNLGERFLYLEYTPTNRRAAASAAIDNIITVRPPKAATAEAVAKFFAELPIPGSPAEIPLEPDARDFLLDLAEWLTLVRGVGTHPLNPMGDVVELTEGLAEVPARVTGQLTVLSLGYALIHGEPTVSLARIQEPLRKIAWSSIPRPTRLVLAAFYMAGDLGQTISHMYDFCLHAKIGKTKIAQIVKELTSLGVIEQAVMGEAKSDFQAKRRLTPRARAALTHPLGWFPDTAWGNTTSKLWETV